MVVPPAPDDRSGVTADGTDATPTSRHRAARRGPGRAGCWPGAVVLVAPGLAVVGVARAPTPARHRGAVRAGAARARGRDGPGRAVHAAGQHLRPRPARGHQMPEYRDLVTEVITPKFGTDFEENVPAAEQTVAQAGVGPHRRVYATGVSTIDPDSATALVAGSFTNSYPRDRGRHRARRATEPSPVPGARSPWCRSTASGWSTTSSPVTRGPRPDAVTPTWYDVLDVEPDAGRRRDPRGVARRDRRPRPERPPLPRCSTRPPRCCSTPSARAAHDEALAAAGRRARRAGRRAAPTGADRTPRRRRSSRTGAATGSERRAGPPSPTRCRAGCCRACWSLSAAIGRAAACGLASTVPSDAAVAEATAPPRRQPSGRRAGPVLRLPRPRRTRTPRRRYLTAELPQGLRPALRPDQAERPRHRDRGDAPRSSRPAIVRAGGRPGLRCCSSSTGRPPTPSSKTPVDLQGPGHGDDGRRSTATGWSTSLDHHPPRDGLSRAPEPPARTRPRCLTWAAGAPSSSRNARRRGACWPCRAPGRGVRVALCACPQMLIACPVADSVVVWRDLISSPSKDTSWPRAAPPVTPRPHLVRKDRRASRGSAAPLPSRPTPSTG